MASLVFFNRSNEQHSPGGNKGGIMQLLIDSKSKGRAYRNIPLARITRQVANPGGRAAERQNVIGYRNCQAQG